MSVIFRWVVLISIVMFANCISAFDGNLFADLAIGVPQETADGFFEAGIVNIMYNDGTGLTDVNNRYFHQSSTGMEDSCEEGDEYSKALISGDFNGDSFMDLASGVHYEQVGDAVDAGAVSVIYGTAAGLSAETIPDQFFTMDSFGLPDGASNSDELGASLSSGDFNGDGFDDLAIGVIGKMIGSSSYAGAVVVINGGIQGLEADTAQLWSQDSEGIEGTAQTKERFGRVMTSGDANGDGFDDLAIAVPADKFEADETSGCVHFLYGSPGGLTITGSQCFWQGKDGTIADVREPQDYFGGTLTMGDFNRDGFDDLVIGVKNEDIGDVMDAGTIHVLYGSNKGITVVGSQYTGFSIIEEYFQFGAALASGDLNGDGFADLVIGIPSFSLQNKPECGAIAVAFGSEDGLVFDFERYSQGDGTIPDDSEETDLFGSILACGDFNRDGYCDVAVGVPEEDIETPVLIEDAGSINIIYGSATGLTAAGSQVWTQDTGTIAGVAEAGDRFGASLAVSNWSGSSSACSDVGVTLWMPGNMFTPGDLCRCIVSVCNPNSNPISDLPLFVILDVAGTYFFAPSFSSFDNYLGNHPVFEPGLTEISVLPAFDWPSGAGSFNGCVWYAALTNPAMTSIYGSMDSWEFGWSY